MSLGAVRSTILANAEVEAAAEVARAETSAAQQVQSARDAAATRVAEAHAAAEVDADAQFTIERAAVRRQARRIVLEAQARARSALVRDAISSLQARRGTATYQELIDRFAQRSKEQLGPDTDIRESEAGGVIGTCGRRSVDYTLPAVVERAVDAIGPDIEELWR